MKTQIFSVMIIGLLLTSWTYNNRLTPPGTKYIKDLGYFVDESVISIEDWEEFYFFVKNNYGVDSAKNCLPDTNIIIAHYGKNIFLSRNINNKQPIVGVSFAQIESYCDFRSQAVNRLKKFENKKVSYELLDDETENFLTLNPNKNLKKIHQELIEVIKIKGETPIYKLPKELPHGAFSFRCIAFIKE